MKYEQKLTIRLFLLLSIILLSYKLFYQIIFKITIYLTKLSLYTYNPQQVNSTMLLTNGHLMEFVPACIMFPAYILLAILILATKDIQLKTSIKIFLIGSLIILTANIIRIKFLFWVLINYGYKLFDILHLFFWKVISSIFVVLVWLCLARHYKIKTIPIYSDIKELKKHIKFFKKKYLKEILKNKKRVIIK